jgi:8-oxo-dGTP diphosphatase
MARDVPPKQVFGRLPADYLKHLLIEFCPRCGSRCEARQINELPRSVCMSCDYIHFVNPSPAVAVVVVEDGRVLLCRRAPGTGHAGLWCLPSGHIEYNEDFLTAGLREVEEEAGLQIEITGLLSVMSNFWDHGSSTLVAVLLARPLFGEPAADGRETTDARWFIADQLPELAWGADEHIIRRYFATRDAGAAVDSAFVRLRDRDLSYTPPPASSYPMYL